MNIVVTTKCRKNCPYCFAAYTRNKNIAQSMSLKTFKEILDKSQDCEYFKILGGEPTDHPQFTQLLDMACSYKKETVVISNFLFNEKIREYLVEKISQGAALSFLVNASDLDINNRMSVWQKNYNAIYSCLYEQDREEKISCGTTIAQDKSVDYYMNYLDFLRSKVIAIERFRVAIPFQGGETRYPELIVNNKNLGKTLHAITQYCLTHGITPVLDERIYPCLFSNKEEIKYVKKFLEGARHKFKCVEPPFDVFPNKEISYCYPLKERIKFYFDDYGSATEARDVLKTAYTIMKHDLKKQLPKDCLKCVFYKTASCDGVSVCLINAQ